jgi:Ser/Thr protein kinase RdoA (MazF antagonist)
MSGLLAFGPAVVFLGLYVAGLVYTVSHSKQGNLWLMILEIIALPLTWFTYLMVIKAWWGVRALTRKSLGALPTYVMLAAIMLAVLHLCGFQAAKPGEQLAWAFLPYGIAAALRLIYVLMKGAEEHKKHQV